MKYILSVRKDFLIIVLFFIMAGNAPWAQAVVAIGMTDFPLGENAFPSLSACLDPTGCGSPDNRLVDFDHPLHIQVPAEDALTGNRLDLVAIDLDANDEIRLIFPVPIVNQPGLDVYIGQASFIGTSDGLGDAIGINDVGIRFGASATWHALSLSNFTADNTIGAEIVTYQDPELKQDAYQQLWFITLDLSDYGFNAGEAIEQVTIRGSINQAGSGLDAAIVGNLNSAPVSAAVPDVVGLAQTVAEAAIADAGLNVGTVITAHSDTVPAGNVISQNPTSGSLVAPGSPVNLVVSSGPAPVTVPNVVGLSQAAAQTAIITASLSVGAISSAHSDTVPAGNVISQNPAAGASVSPASMVYIEVSLGPTPVIVPDVVGQSQAAAESAIMGAGLSVGAVSSAHSDTVTAGSVISQIPAAGTSVPPASAVDIEVSLGPTPVMVPNVVGQSQAAAESAIVGAGLSVGAVSSAHSDTVTAGSVISQNPAAGASVLPASTVDIEISLGPASVIVPEVVGLSEADAEAAITGAGLNVGTLSTQNSDTVPPDDVISQSPAGGTSAAFGSAVDLVVSLGPENRAPLAHAGPDQTVLVGDTVTLDGSGSSDADGDLLSFSWALTAVPAGSAVSLSDPTAIMPSFAVDVAGTYAAQLIVNDGLVASTPDTVAISTQNSAPVADAGDDQSVFTGDTVTLDGSGSGDVDGDDLFFSWTLRSVPAGSSAALSDPTALKPAFDVDLPGTYLAQLIVNDGLADSAPDTVTISTQNSTPVADAGADQLFKVGDTVTLDGSGSSDADGDGLTFSWALIAVPAASAATLSDPMAIAPSFVADVAGIYVAQLIVNDGLADSAPDTVAVTEIFHEAMNGVNIEKAEWNDEKLRLSVEGHKAPAGSTVLVISAESDEALGTAVVDEEGEWIFEVFDIIPVPCRIGVEIEGLYAESRVKKTPTTCDTNAAIPDRDDQRSSFHDTDGGIKEYEGEMNGVNIERPEWQDEKRRLKVKGQKAPAGSTVYLTSAGSGRELGTAVADREGKWQLEMRDIISVPCRIGVEIEGDYAEINVKKAPEDCD